MPGVHDAHTHLLFSGLKFRYECRLTPIAGAEQVVADVTGCCGHEAPDLGGWVVGGEFFPMAIENDGPDRASLDEAFPTGRSRRLNPRNPAARHSPVQDHFGGVPPGPGA